MVTLVAVADTTLNQDFPSFNMGGHSHVAAGVTASGGLRRGVFRFDLTGAVPAGARIDSAQLGLAVRDGNVANPSPFELHRVLADWNEGAKTGNNGAPAASGDATWAWRAFQQAPWTVPGGAADVDYVAAASSVTQVGGVGDYAWLGLESDIARWIAEPTQNYGWILIGSTEAASRTARRFASREAGADGPSLTIQFTLPPAILGDANADGRVDLSDFGTLKDNFGLSPADRNHGDFNDDGRVDLADFGLLKDNFGQGVTVAVSEPSTAVLSAAGSVLALIGRFLARADHRNYRGD